ncbi:E3 ubiquitin-protein ligase TRIM33-like [Tachypleus tridentatus]|uniref:E3 ubiquitin-protein ligase TRIM33-like n=1 Tax=Tachypleus tridentatus TaxID=6853 RepID=UPI003FD3572A
MLTEEEKPKKPHVSSSNTNRVTPDVPTVQKRISLKCVFCTKDLILGEVNVPKMLPCLHSACGTCVLKIGTNNVTQTVTCPSCKQGIDLNNTVDHFLFLEHMTKAKPVWKRETGKSVLCTSCDDGNSTVGFCVECQEWLCNACIGAHERVRLTKDHKIQQQKEMKKYVTEVLQKYMFCPIHKKEQVKIYCELCNKLICGDCQLLDHKDHKYQFLATAYEQHKACLSDLLSKVQEKHKYIRKGIELIGKREKDVKERESQVAQDIKLFVIKFIRKLSQRGKLLIEELNEICNSKKQELSEKNKNLVELSEKLQYCVNFVEEVISSGTCFALLYNRKAMTEQLQYILNQRCEVPNPNNSVNIQFLYETEFFSDYINQLGCLVVDHKPVEGKLPIGVLRSLEPLQGPHHSSISHNTQVTSTLSSSNSQPNGSSLILDQLLDHNNLTSTPEHCNTQALSHLLSSTSSTIKPWVSHTLETSDTTPGRKLSQVSSLKDSKSLAEEFQSNTGDTTLKETVFTVSTNINLPYFQSSEQKPDMEGSMISTTQTGFLNNTSTPHQKLGAPGFLSVKEKQSVCSTLPLSSGKMLLNLSVKQDSGIQPSQCFDAKDTSCSILDKKSIVYTASRTLNEFADLSQRKVPDADILQDSLRPSVFQKKVFNTATLNPEIQECSNHSPVPLTSQVCPIIISITGSDGSVHVPGEVKTPKSITEKTDEMKNMEGNSHEEMKQKNDLVGKLNSMKNSLTLLGSSKFYDKPVEDVQDNRNEGVLCVPQTLLARSKSCDIPFESSQNISCQETVVISSASLARSKSCDIGDISVVSLLNSGSKKGLPVSRDSKCRILQETDNVSFTPNKEIPFNHPEMSQCETRDKQEQASNGPVNNNCIIIDDDSAESSSDDTFEDWCAVCHDGGELLCCGSCPRVYHLRCHVPSLTSTPRDNWTCLMCLDVNNATLPQGYRGTKRKALVGLNGRSLLCCERILLELFCHDSSSPFHQPISRTVPNYHKVITKPMDLMTVKQKLSPTHFNFYQDEGEFVSDLKLIFRNCCTFNPVGSTLYNTAKLLEDFLQTLLKNYLPYECSDQEVEIVDQISSTSSQEFVPPNKRQKI